VDDKDKKIHELELEIAKLQGEIQGLRQAVPVPWYPIYPRYVEPPPYPISPFWEITCLPTTTTF